MTAATLIVRLLIVMLVLAIVTGVRYLPRMWKIEQEIKKLDEKLKR